MEMISYIHEIYFLNCKTVSIIYLSKKIQKIEKNLFSEHFLKFDLKLT